jgi:hypothetical protein
MNHIAIFEIAKFDVEGESIDEKRNQESRPEEEGCSEEKEVARARPEEGPIKQVPLRGPGFRGLFLFADSFPSRSFPRSSATLQARPA